MSRENEAYIVEQLKRLDDLFRNNVISLDVDNLELDTVTPAINKFNSDSRVKAPKHKRDLTRYFGMVKWYEDLGETKEDALRKARSIWDDPQVLYDARPESGALILSRHFCDVGINPFRITSRPATTRVATVDSYTRYMPWVDPARIIQQTDGDQIGLGFKVMRIRDLGVRIHFDDSYEHALEIVNKTNATVVINPQPWNSMELAQNTHPRIIAPIWDWKTPGKLAAIYMRLAMKIL